MRTVVLALSALIVTPVLASLVIFGRLLGVRDRLGGIYDSVPRWWSKVLLWIAAVELRVADSQHIGGGEPRIFLANHVSWFDVLALAAVLPRAKFVAKAELFKVPVFGQAIRAAGMIEIQRENRKAAFGAYDLAGARIRNGNPVVVFPEGTRGRDYPLRTFKKGPFVLAIASGVPVVPVVIHGSIERMSRDSLRVRPGFIDVVFLEPIPTAGYTYEDRDQLAALVRNRMAEALEKRYGVTPVTRAPQIQNTLPFPSSAVADG